MGASKTLTKSQRSQRASIAAFASWAKRDPHTSGEAGQRGLLAKFEKEAREHESGLTDAEYARRAGCAYKGHMARLAFLSSKARTRKARTRKAGGRKATATPVTRPTPAASAQDVSLAQVDALDTSRIPTTGEPERRTARGRRLTAQRARKAGGGDAA